MKRVINLSIVFILISSLNFNLSAQVLKLNYAVADNKAGFFYPENNNSIKAKGKVNNDTLKVGKWEYFYKDGSLAGVAFFNQDGKPTGKWLFYLKNKIYKKIIVKNNFAIVIERRKPRIRIELKDIYEPIELPSLKFTK
jgi:antitoxin component YwqK of YwqJK toxin-antitoxin module